MVWSWSSTACGLFPVLFFVPLLLLSPVSSNSAQLQWEVLSNQMIVVQNNDDVDFKF